MLADLGRAEGPCLGGRDGACSAVDTLAMADEAVASGGRPGRGCGSSGAITLTPAGGTIAAAPSVHGGRCREHDEGRIAGAPVSVADSHADSALGTVVVCCGWLSTLVAIPNA